MNEEKRGQSWTKKEYMMIKMRVKPKSDLTIVFIDLITT